MINEINGFQVIQLFIVMSTITQLATAPIEVPNQGIYEIYNPQILLALLLYSGTTN